MFIYWAVWVVVNYRLAHLVRIQQFLFICFKLGDSNDSADFDPRNSFQSIEFDDKLWLIGRYDEDSLNDVWSSTDGDS